MLKSRLIAPAVPALISATVALALEHLDHIVLRNLHQPVLMEVQ